MGVLEEQPELLTPELSLQAPKASIKDTYC